MAGFGPGNVERQQRKTNARDRESGSILPKIQSLEGKTVCLEPYDGKKQIGVLALMRDTEGVVIRVQAGDSAFLKLHKVFSVSEIK